ncbi:YceI family protein [Pseudoflavitalea rhizosphaerae]|uniref:YceI family protein n=1 Tax=Pseudoflavitalea rhizosphaerae TaxID=1884793 RepID=UPI000F8DBA80|nr:YceI family protein [Pseudoflavitalea rhizosphaerae]
MKQRICLLLLYLVLMGSAFPQGKFFTRTGQISFSSKGILETIKAQNKTVTCVLDAQTGQIQFSVLMRGFEFKKALMQEHFNENYVESDKYPTAEFKGQISSPLPDLSKDGSYPVNVKGKMTIHGITQELTTDGTLTVQQGNIKADAAFNILLSDYKIRIPSIVKNNLSNTVTIAVNCSLQPLQ